MSADLETRHLYGKAIGIGLAGLASLAADGVIITPANAGPVHGGWDLKKNTKLFYEPPPESSYKHGGSTGRASLDADGDGQMEIISTSVGGSDSTLSFLKFEGLSSSLSVFKFFRPYSFTDSIDTRVAIGDLDRDGMPDVVAAAAMGSSSSINVTSLDALSSLQGPLEGSSAFDHDLTSGVSVSISNAAGTRGMIVAGSSRSAPDASGLPPATSTIRSGDLDFSGVPLPHDGQLTKHIKWQPSFAAYGEQYSGGIRVATGDVDGDGVDDVVTLNESGSSRVARIHKHSPDLSMGVEFSLFSELELSSGSPDAPCPSFALGDVDGDGLDDLAVGSPMGAPPTVRIYQYDPNGIPPGPEGGLVGTWSLMSTLDVFDPSYLGGVDVELTDFTGDGFADLVFVQSLIPEPSTALAVFGAAMLVGRRRRKV